MFCVEQYVKTIMKFLINDLIIFHFEYKIIVVFRATTPPSHLCRVYTNQMRARECKQAGFVDDHSTLVRVRCLSQHKVNTNNDTLANYKIRRHLTYDPTYIPIWKFFLIINLYLLHRFNRTFTFQSSWANSYSSKRRIHMRALINCYLLFVWDLIVCSYCFEFIISFNTSAFLS